MPPLPQKKDDAYLLRLTGTQADLVQHALDLYARIGIGQLEELLHHPACRPAQWNAGVHDASERSIRELKANLFGVPRDAAYSIFSPQVLDAMRAAWDIRNVIRHRRAWDRVDNSPERNVETTIGVDFDEPQQASQEPLPTITREPRPG